MTKQHHPQLHELDDTNPGARRLDLMATERYDVVHKLVSLVDQMNEQRAKLEYELCNGNVVGMTRCWTDDRATIFTITRVARVKPVYLPNDPERWTFFSTQGGEEIPQWAWGSTTDDQRQATIDFLLCTVPA